MHQLPTVIGQLARLHALEERQMAHSR